MTILNDLVDCVDRCKAPNYNRYVLPEEVLEILQEATYLGARMDMLKRKLFYKSPEGNPELNMPAISDDQAYLLHAVIGQIGEACEMAEVGIDLVLDRPVDEVNAIEEMGDQIWYIGLGARSLGSDVTEVIHANLRKLKARYPGKFDYTERLNSSKDTERAAIVGAKDV